MSDALKIKVIIGTTRQNRFSEKPAHWIFELLKKREGVEAELLDLRDYPMPFFNEPVSPSYKKEPYIEPVVAAWTKKVAESDGFIVVTGEYNHGYPAVLKNALDYVGSEWSNKPIGFVGYGSALGARAIVALRVVSVELSMAPIKYSVHIPGDIYMAASKQETPTAAEAFKPLEERANGLIDQLIRWAGALKTAR